MKAIVNVNRDWAIGRGNDLLCRIPEDMRFFRSATAGKTVVMGRKTLESFPGKKPLKGRVNVVLTRDASRIPGEALEAADTSVILDDARGADELDRILRKREQKIPEGQKPETVLVLVSSPEKLLKYVRSAVSSGVLKEEDVCIIGGASVYEKMLPYCDFCLVTVNDYDPPADAPADSWFPNLDADPGWVKIRQGDMKESEGVHFCFCEYAKRMDPPAVASDL